jgi:hypothetical protein
MFSKIFCIGGEERPNKPREGPFLAMETLSKQKNRKT